MTYFLNLRDVRRICYEYAKTHLAFNEPIPPFETRFAGKLELAIACPSKRLNGRLVYKNLEKQAAILFYEMIKLHPFLNGNKRIACVALTTFLSLNHKWVKLNWMDLYNWAVKVASSESDERKDVITLLCRSIKTKIVNYRDI